MFSVVIHSRLWIYALTTGWGWCVAPRQGPPEASTGRGRGLRILIQEKLFPSPLFFFCHHFPFSLPLSCNLLLSLSSLMCGLSFQERGCHAATESLLLACETMLLVAGSGSPRWVRRSYRILPLVVQTLGQWAISDWRSVRVIEVQTSYRVVAGWSGRFLYTVICIDESPTYGLQFHR